jgi:hypothetical protein
MKQLRRPTFFFIFVVSILANMNAMALDNQVEFRFVTDTSDGLAFFYIAPTTIQKKGSIVSAWALQNYYYENGSGEGQSILYTIAVDCAAKEFQDGAGSYWSKKDAGGANISSLGSNPPQAMTPLVERADISNFYLILCQPRAEVSSSLNRIEKSSNQKGIVTRVKINIQERLRNDPHFDKRGQ